MQQQNHQMTPLFGRVDDLGKRIEMLEETVAQLKSLDSALHEIQHIVFSYVAKIREGVVLIQDEVIRWANPAACQILGYTLEEVVNTSAVQVVHPKFRQQLSARYAMVQAGDEIPAGAMWPCITKTREIRYIRPFSYRVMYDGKPAIMAFFYDVTEEKKLHEDLQMRAEMLDAVTDSVFLLDLSGDIIYVNRAVCDTMGYTRDEMKGMNIIDINPPELRSKANIRLKQASEHRESRFRTVHMCKDGSRLPVVVRIKVVKWAGKDYVLGVVREVATEGELDI
jgi:PAS domain S-box-containing protein